MDFIIFDEQFKEKYEDDIFRMLSEGDKEFVPPLSCRTSTTQKNLSSDCAAQSTDGIKAYFDGMMEQLILGCLEDERLLGFMSFRENYTCDCIDESTFPNIYISTLIVSPEARGKGLTKKMYSYLFGTVYSDRNIFTRTWSTNGAHIAILEKFGFKNTVRIENDRGQGIDTVYFEKKK